MVYQPKTALACAVLFATAGTIVALWHPKGALAKEPRIRVEEARVAAAQAGSWSPAQLQVIGEATFARPGITQFKLLDPEGNILGVVLDSRGRSVGPLALETWERAIEKERFPGGLELELVEYLRGRGPTERIRAHAWMDGVATGLPPRAPNLTRVQYTAGLRAIEAEMLAAQSEFIKGMRSRGGRLLNRASYAPLTTWDLSVGELRAASRQHPEVRFFLEHVHAPRLDVSRLAVQADILNARGLAGNGRRIAVVEPGRVAAHTNLPAAQRIVCSTQAGATGGVSDHKTLVAGVTQSTHPTIRGMAPGATLLDGVAANFSDSEIIGATDCVIANGADVVNMSFGVETNGSFDAFARFIDRTVYSTGVLIVPAVSNLCANRVGSPEVAFNVLAVGAFGDSNTAFPGDDLAACTGPVGFSAFLNPLSTSGDREEPDVVAPGNEIGTTNGAGGFAIASGTSFSAPHVAALAALLVERDPTLAIQAERLRAIIMASARRSIEGAARLSNRDGAGAIQMAAADAVLLDGSSELFALSGGTAGFPIQRPFFASAGQRVRVAISWAQKSPAGDALIRPTTDLDLRVVQPSGSLTALSASFDNNYEIVEFTAPVTGTYRADILNFRPSPGAEFIGFAASRFEF